MNFSGAIHLNKTGLTILSGLVILLLLYSMSRESNGQTNLIDLQKLLHVAVKAAECGGKKVVETKDTMKVHSKGLTKEGLQDSVTTADFLSHCAIVNILRYHFNSLKIISEENHSCKEDKPIEYSLTYIPDLYEDIVDINDLTVWIDPLDATQEYTEKSANLYKYITTMVCIAVKGKPIIGVIHKPFSKETSWAWVGKGMSKDLKSTKNPGAKKKIIISRSHQGEIDSMLKQKIKDDFELIIAAGAGYKALEVAYGNADAYMHSTMIKKWDICAGNAILAAKGGKMTTKYNKTIDYSDSVHLKNEDGLIATLENHERFLGKL